VVLEVIYFFRGIMSETFITFFRMILLFCTILQMQKW